MEYIFLYIGLYSLIMFFPWYIVLYTEGEIKARLVMFGFIRVPINLKRALKVFTQRKSEKNDINIMEILENIKKIQSIRPMYKDILKKSYVKHFYWYTAIPMENPLLGLSFLPLYTTAQAYFIDYFYDTFKVVKNVDIETKYNYLNNDIFIYFDCIIQTNLGKIIIVSVKYIKKIPLLFKKVS